MPVRRFRSVQEMEETAWLEPGDPRLLDAIRHCWALAELLTPIRFPPGVYKHRSIESLNAQRDAWEEAALRDLEARRCAGEPASGASGEGDEGAGVGGDPVP